MKYLGIPLSPNKLTRQECQQLVEKITNRIRGWNRNKLSYAGRIRLTNAVLMNMHIYWSSIIILPEAVIQQVIQMCRSFLWRGDATSTRSPLVAWDILCKPKSKGGLGIKQIEARSIAVVDKYVWNIASKADNLWVKWVNHIYLEGTTCWEYKASASASWSSKQIVRVKNSLKDEFHNQTGKWKGNKSGNYTIADTYKWLTKDESPNLHWTKVVWSRFEHS